jgi:LysM repeat protein
MSTPVILQHKRFMYIIAGFALAAMLILLTATAFSGDSSVRGTVYLDSNHNGMRDAGEPGVPNVYVRVAVFSDAWSHEFYTGDDGTYAPVAMSAGDYYIRLILPECYKPTTQTQHGVWLMDHQVILGLDFGIAPMAHCGKPEMGGSWGGGKDVAGMPGMGMPGMMPGKDAPSTGGPDMSGPPPSAEAPMATTHVVQAGETIDSIAELYRVSIASLMEVNNLTDPSQIYVGQVLQLPGPGMDMTETTAAEPQAEAAAPEAAAPAPEAAAPAPEAAAPAPTGEHNVYVVQPGDYLGKIALEHESSVSAIAVANNIADVNLLFVGQELLIP